MQAIESEEILIFDGRVRTARRGAQLPVVTTWLGYHGRWLGLPKERRLECGKLSHKKMRASTGCGSQRRCGRRLLRIPHRLRQVLVVAKYMPLNIRAYMPRPHAGWRPTAFAAAHLLERRLSKDFWSF
jgi:hypothetical protein